MSREEKSRDLLLKAGERIFAEKGFDGARVEEIARKAGVNIRMLYHHFGSKKGLFLEITRMLHREISRRQEAIFRRDLDPRSMLFDALDDIFDFLEKRETFVRITGWVMLSKGRLKEATSVGREYALKVLKPRIEELSRKGGWNPAVKPMHVIMICWSLIFFWFLNREEFHSLSGRGGPGTKDRKYLEQVKKVLEEGLIGKGGRKK